MKLMWKATMVVLALGFLTNACTQDEESVEEVVNAEVHGEGAHKFTVNQKGQVKFEAEVVYFEFDDYTLTKEGMARLDGLAKYMAENKTKKIKIAGHCDSRGSTEYNLALGQLRSQAVKRYLATLGITEGRLDAISFGEEQPAIAGDSEESWAKNRRAEFSFVGENG